ncbi:MAG: hypothetical protein ABIP38_01810 [Steroidobacteraceae bacterium]
MNGPLRAASSRPDSRVAGVRIGVISSAFGNMPAAQIIPAMLQIGLSEIELTAAHAEALAGAPPASVVPPVLPLISPVLNADGLQPRCAQLPLVLPYSITAGEPARGETVLTAEQQAEQSRLQSRLREWRAATTPATWQAVRRQFEDAGITVRVLWSGMGYVGPVPTDADIDYAFRMARGLGVSVLSGSSKLAIAPSLARAAATHGLPWAGHTQDNIHNPELFATPEAYDKLLALGPQMRICLDIGYFTAAGFDSVSYIRQHHSRIAEIHLKDRKRSRSLGGDVTHNLVNNWPWGQGDTPIREVLQLLRDEKWDIPAQIEFDHGCRTTSGAVTEIARCFAYCREALA